jgi:hypothetical protein
MAKPSEWQIDVHYDGHPPFLTGTLIGRLGRKSKAAEGDTAAS